MARGHATAEGKFRKTPMFAVSQDCDTLAKKQTWKANGGTHVVVQAGWDVMQASAGATPAAGVVTALKAKFADAATAGLRVIFEPAVQYTPTWVQTGVPKFKNQFATDYTGTNPGELVRDWVWSETGRGYLMDFYLKTFGVLTSTETTLIDTVRCGFGYFGETSYPPVGSDPVSFWGFSSPAQTGTGLATDQVVCPNPGYVPFNAAPLGTVATANDLAWVAWYRNAATVRCRSIVDQLRTVGWGGRIHVLHPSTGLRTNWPTSDGRYRDQNSKGCDWDHQMASYMQVADTYPWCTWGNQPDWTYPPVAADDNAPWRWMRSLADARGRTSYMWGENAGGANNTEMTAMFAANTGMMANKWTGLMWVDWNSLQGANPTLANLASLISGYTAS